MIQMCTLSSSSLLRLQHKASRSHGRIAGITPVWWDGHSGPSLCMLDLGVTGLTCDLLFPTALNVWHAPQGLSNQTLCSGGQRMAMGPLWS